MRYLCCGCSEFKCLHPCVNCENCLACNSLIVVRSLIVFLCLALEFHSMCMHFNILPACQGDPCADLEPLGSPLLWYSAHQILATTGFLTSSLFWLPSLKPCSVPLFLKYLQEESQVEPQGSPLILFSLGSLSNAAYVTTAVSDILSTFLVIYKAGADPVPSPVIQPEVEVPDTFYICHLV